MRPLVPSRLLQAPAATNLPASKPLQHSGRRRTVRRPVKGHVTILVDGNPSRLVNLSASGAQVLTPKPFCPHESVRIQLLDGSAETCFRAVVAWSAPELAGARTQYRAGMAFTDPDPQILKAFCRLHGLSSDAACGTPPKRPTITAPQSTPQFVNE